MEPDGRRTLYVLGYPKSGTTWLARLMGDALDSPVGASYAAENSRCIATEGQDRPGPFYVRQSHSIPVEDEGGPVIARMGNFAHRNLTDEGVVYMTRDPRDLVLSVAHHWGLNLERAFTCMARGEWPVHHGGGYEPFMRAWLATECPAVWTSYERLSARPGAEVRRILRKLGVSFSLKQVTEAAERQAFAARRVWTEQHGDSLPYGKAFQLRFLRRGIAGAWRDELPADLLERVQQRWGPVMAELGYIVE